MRQRALTIADDILDHTISICNDDSVMVRIGDVQIAIIRGEYLSRKRECPGAS